MLVPVKTIVKGLNPKKSGRRHLRETDLRSNQDKKSRNMYRNLAELLKLESRTYDDHILERIASVVKQTKGLPEYGRILCAHERCDIQSIIQKLNVVGVPPFQVYSDNSMDNRLSIAQQYFITNHPLPDHIRQDSTSSDLFVLESGSLLWIYSWVWWSTQVCSLRGRTVTMVFTGMTDKLLDELCTCDWWQTMVAARCHTLLMDHDRQGYSVAREQYQPYLHPDKTVCTMYFPEAMCLLLHMDVEDCQYRAFKDKKLASRLIQRPNNPDHSQLTREETMVCLTPLCPVQDKDQDHEQDQDQEQDQEHTADTCEQVDRLRFKKYELLNDEHHYTIDFSSVHI